MENRTSLKYNKLNIVLLKKNIRTQKSGIFFEVGFFNHAIAYDQNDSRYIRKK